MTSQNDRQDRSLTGQVRDQAGHCPLTDRYFQPCLYKAMLGHSHLLHTVLCRLCFVTDPRYSRAAGITSVSGRFRSKEQGTRVFLRSQNRKSRSSSFLGLPLLRKNTKTLATQANPWEQEFFSFQVVRFLHTQKINFQVQHWHRMKLQKREIISELVCSTILENLDN